MSRQSLPLPRVQPEAVGIPSSAVESFVIALEAAGGAHSFMVLRRGQVAAEGWWKPYTPERPHLLFSLSKSFTSTAVGLAVEEGHLSLDDTVISFFPECLPQETPDNLRNMRVHHLLSMATGHDEDTTGRTRGAADGDWVRAFLSLPVEHVPGTKFVYNTAATYLCSAILQKLTGETVLDYLDTRLFMPLGIPKPTWQACPRGRSVGGSGLSLRTEDIARFGQCLLQNGMWNGQQVIPASWITKATTAQVANGDPADNSDWTQGYGYQFWRCRHGFYRGDGAFGQFCVVMPEHDAVVAITGGMNDLQAPLNAIWDHLLPAMNGPAPVKEIVSTSLPPRRFEIPVPKGQPSSMTARSVSGKVYQLDPNAQDLQTVVFGFQDERSTVVFRGENTQQTIVSGFRDWVDGTAPGREGWPRMGTLPADKTAVRGAWTDDSTFSMTLCYVEMPYIETVTCRFEGTAVRISRRFNVGFTPDDRADLVGTMV